MIRGPASGVNWSPVPGRLLAVSSAVLISWTVLPGCHLGRPPSNPARVGQVEVPFAQAGLPEAVRQGLADALAQRSALGGSRILDCRVLSAEALPAAVGQAGGRVERARLEVQYSLSGSRPAQVTLVAERSFSVSVQDSLSAERARAAAFHSLAQQLGAEAADWVTALR